MIETIKPVIEQTNKEPILSMSSLLDRLITNREEEIEILKQLKGDIL